MLGELHLEKLHLISYTLKFWFMFFSMFVKKNINGSFMSYYFDPQKHNINGIFCLDVR